MNSPKTDSIQHVNIGSQTNISGIITENQDENWKLKAPKPLYTTFIWSLILIKNFLFL